MTKVQSNSENRAFQEMKKAAVERLQGRSMEQIAEKAAVLLKKEQGYLELESLGQKIQIAYPSWELQEELGCPEEKIRVTPNGILVEGLSDLPGKNEEEKQYINAGAILRVTPIKDVKTMIQAFDFAKKQVENLKLWIMGPTDEDEKYARECFELVETLGVKDVEFTGRVNIKDYLGKMDFTLLTSISEGQPLTILESYAAHKPVIATDVGNCRELIYGSKDDFGEAGILTHIMNIEETANAMVRMAVYEKDRVRMGEAGYRRVNAFYRIEQMKAVYQDIYKGFAEQHKIPWTEEPFQIR